MDQPLPEQIQEAPSLPVNKPFPHLWLIAGVVIVVGSIGLMVANKLLNAPKAPTVQVVEVPTPTPTPIRVFSAVATQSAFIALEEAHASLSAGLTATNLDDPSLSPPVLDLTLGFRQ